MSKPNYATPVEVDGWYSWVVVGVCFVIYFFGFGIIRISGLFFTDIVSYYNVDREQAATPFLMGSIARSFSGPVCGYLSHTFGFRFSIALGCFLSSLGILGSSFAQDLNLFSVFWTVFGFGYGMASSILPRVINMFSKKHASKACGFALCGVSIAGIVMPFLIVDLLNAYGLTGTLLNLSAMMLNTFPGIILLRDPSFRSSKDGFRKQEHVDDNCDETKSAQKANEILCDNLKMDTKGKLDCLSDSKKQPTSEGVAEVQCEGERTTHTNVRKWENEKVGSLDAHEVSKINASNNATKDDSNTIRDSEPSFPNRHTLKTKQNYFLLIRIFWDPLFIYFSILRGLIALLFVIVPMILIDLSIDKGVPKHQTSYVLMACCVSELFGKMFLGWITDGNYISRVKYVSLCFFIEGLSFVFLVWSRGFLAVTISAVIGAVGIATIAPNFYVLVCQYFEKEKLSVIIPSLEFFLLPFFFGTKRLIGYFRDELGSYDGLAYTLGATCVVFSFLILWIPSISRWRLGRKDKTADVDK